MSQMSVADIPAQQVAVVRRTVPAAALSAFYAEVLGAVGAAVQRAGGVLAGPAFGWFHGEPGETVDVAGGFPVSGLADGSLEGGVEVLQRPGGLAVVAVHVGPLDTLEETYRELDAWLRDRQLDPADNSWEEYLSDPQAEPDPAAWQTRIVKPLQ